MHGYSLCMFLYGRALEIDCRVTDMSIFSYKSEIVFCTCLYNLFPVSVHKEHISSYPLSLTLILSNFDFNQYSGWKFLSPLFFFGFPWLLVRLIIFLYDDWPFVLSILLLLVCIQCSFFYWIVPFFFLVCGSPPYILCIKYLLYLFPICFCILLHVF